jgi:hypothetical protein
VLSIHTNSIFAHDGLIPYKPAMRALHSFLLFLLASPCFAISFTPEEIEAQAVNATLIATTAAECLDATYADHIAFFDQHGVSKYYGNRRAQHQTRAGRIAELKRFKKDPALVDLLKPISCIGLTLQCMKEGFARAGQEKTWAKIARALAVDNKFYGTDLLEHLHSLGWRTLYWNPDPSKNAAWDAEDRRIAPAPAGRTWNAVWGGHAIHYRSATTRAKYQNIPIDDAQSLVGFLESPPSEFLKTPFFVGIAHSGYHVFPGRTGDVIEAHSTRLLNSRENLEFNSFNPIAPGGAPKWTRSERYRSGVIAVPPGY